MTYKITFKCNKTLKFIEHEHEHDKITVFGF